MQSDSGQPTIQGLFDLLDAWSDADYPEGVKPARQRISGLAFFPGGCGLWTDPPSNPVSLSSALPVGGIMVIAHNFDSEESYNKLLARGYGAAYTGAWGGLRKLLPGWGIHLEDCFFTNAYMGLKADVNPSTGRNEPSGRFPGADDPAFVARCRAFLLTQMQAQQPRLVMTLGKEVPPILVPLTPELSAIWSAADDLRELDRRDAALVSNVRFPGVERPTTVLALTHPSNREPNVKRRRYRGLEGKDAEDALAHDGLAASGLLS